MEGFKVYLYVATIKESQLFKKNKILHKHLTPNSELFESIFQQVILPICIHVCR